MSGWQGEWQEWWQKPLNDDERWQEADKKDDGQSQASDWQQPPRVIWVTSGREGHQDEQPP